MITPRIGITLGDPGGISPEIILKSLSGYSYPKASFIIFGARPILEKEMQALGIDLHIPDTNLEETALPPLSLYDAGSAIKEAKRGKPSGENGSLSFLCFEEAVKKAEAKQIDAVVTAPVSKYSWSLAGIKWAGHTEYLSRISPDAIMSFWSKKLKVALLTHHLPLKEALKKVTEKTLLGFFLKLHNQLKKLTSMEYQFLVAGLNPHAGEEGLLGSEENEAIIPAIKDAQKRGMQISGPYPPDIVCRKALNQEDKIVIPLYHDQGLIAFKLIAFDEGVNMTLGLPFIRTSPDHGTAFDIAGKGIANPTSMVEAIRLACEFSVSESQY